MSEFQLRLHENKIKTVQLNSITVKSAIAYETQH